VNPGDILVGKVTPKGESPMTAGGKAAPRHLRREGVRCFATRRLKLPPGVTGTVVDVRRVQPPWRRTRTNRAMAIERAEDRTSCQGPRRRERRSREAVVPQPVARKSLTGPQRQPAGFQGQSRPARTLTEGRCSPSIPAVPGATYRRADDAGDGGDETLKREFDSRSGRLQARFQTAREKLLQRGDELAARRDEDG